MDIDVHTRRLKSRRTGNSSEQIRQRCHPRRGFLRVIPVEIQAFHPPKKRKTRSVPHRGNDYLR
jgi:pyruvate-formate lyase-activating enzyme